MTIERASKYTAAVKDYVKTSGHATNAQVLAHLRKAYPDLSATTVHRITARMVERGELGDAPQACDNAARFDANTKPHDHFQCTHCDRLRDVELPPAIYKSLQEAMGGCLLNGRLTVQGSCSTCMNDKETNHE